MPHGEWLGPHAGAAAERPGQAKDKDVGGAPFPGAAGDVPKYNYARVQFFSEGYGGDHGVFVYVGGELGTKFREFRLSETERQWPTRFDSVPQSIPKIQIAETARFHSID